MIGWENFFSAQFEQNHFPTWPAEPRTSGFNYLIDYPGYVLVAAGTGAVTDVCWHRFAGCWIVRLDHSNKARCDYSAKEGSPISQALRVEYGSYSVRNIALCYRWNHRVNARRWWSVLDSSRYCDLIYQGYPGCMGFAGRDHPLAIIEDNVNSGAGYVVLPFLIQPPHKRSYTSTSMPFDSVQGQMLSSPKKYRLF